MIVHDIPPCPECGMPTDSEDDSDSTCSDCLAVWWCDFLEELGEDGLASLIHQWKQDDKLGIGLDCRSTENDDDDH